MCFLYLEKKRRDKSMRTNKSRNGNNIKIKEDNKMMKLDLYGFGRDENGFVYIKDDEADVIRMIYDMAINGHSLQNIQEELYNRGIKSPSGKDKWTRDVIDKTINNKKYLAYIISFENFFDALIEKESRCRYIRG